MMRSLYTLLLVFLFGCSGLEKSEYDKIRQKNRHEEVITRKSSSYLFPLQEPKKQTRESYSWEVGEKSPSKITKEYFRCKGSSMNPSVVSSEGKMIKDCEGATSHSLPLIHGREGVYPVLLDILNYIQSKTQNKVVITCGHRCPIHNQYADSSKQARTSKHMIGAEVDFYVQGMEERPLDVIDLIFAFYKEGKQSKSQDYATFYRYLKKDTNVSTQPWYNKEIFIKLYQESEGRDYDNRHSYPYIGLQVRFDSRESERVTYTWEKAYKGYIH